MAAGEDSLGVVHNRSIWLPLTENWIYSQLHHLPAPVACSVVCFRLRDGAQYRWPSTYCYAEMDRLTRLGIMLNGVTADGIRFRRSCALLRWAAARSGARVVHSHFGHTASGCAAVVRSLGLAHVVSVYGSDVSKLTHRSAAWRRRYREMFSLVDCVLCEGPRMVDRVAALGCPPGKITLHRLGVPLDRLPFRPRVWRSGETLKVLIASSFREKKGIPYAVEALARLRREVDLHVTIIGDAEPAADSQREKAHILRVIRKHNMNGAVTLMGYQPHQVLMEQAYAAHVFLAPSVTAADGDSEGGSPVVITEMAASGMPVVATSHADIPQLIEHGVSGLLAQERDVAGLVDQLHHLLNHTALWVSMTRAARARVEADFNAALQGEKLAALYHSLALR